MKKWLFVLLLLSIAVVSFKLGASSTPKTEEPEKELSKTRTHFKIWHFKIWQEHATDAFAHKLIEHGAFPDTPEELRFEVAKLVAYTCLLDAHIKSP